MSFPGSPAVRRRLLLPSFVVFAASRTRPLKQSRKALGWSKAKISRYELAQGGLRPSDVESLLDIYGVRGDRRQQLLALAEEATAKGWWEGYSDVLNKEYLAFIGLEAEATASLVWQINVVPGLLQTAQYAWQIFSGYQEIKAAPPTVIERRVQTRLIRQQILTRDQSLKLDGRH